MNILSSSSAFCNRLPRPKIIEQKRILTQSDFLKLDIVDWNRRHPSMTVAEAMDNSSKWFVGTCFYQIIRTDLSAYPERDDFPGWQHVGHHEEMGKLWWNHFHYEFNGNLHFSDSPDFWGNVHYPDYPQIVHFHGDIGKVSPIGLRTGAGQLNANTVWISVVDEGTLIFIATPFNLDRLAHDDKYRESLQKRRPQKQLVPEISTPSLWDE